MASSSRISDLRDVFLRGGELRDKSLPTLHCIVYIGTLLQHRITQSRFIGSWIRRQSRSRPGTLSVQFFFKKRDCV